MPKNRIVIVGGGLAGMAIANELNKRQIPVTIVEASPRLGGKAGSEVNPKFQGNPRSDHGYHIFPSWYVNVRRLLKELGLLESLIDLHCVHYVRQDEFPKRCTLFEPSLRYAWKNIRSGLSYPYVAVLGMYSAIDLSTRRFNEERAILDRQSFNGFIRTRFYATQRLAEIHQGFVLQASAIPSYRLSAMTAANVVSSYFRSPSPLQSILPTDLQSGFIDPFAAHLVRNGVEVRLNTKVSKIHIADTSTSRFRVEAIELETRSDSGATGQRLLLNDGDQLVLATPFDITRAFVSDMVLDAEEGCPETKLSGEECRLTDLQTLDAVPMAGFDVYFNRKLEDIPPEHVICYRSRYELSFIDISQHWTCFKNPGQPTVLSGIASNFVPLKTLSPDAALDELLHELVRYLPFKASDVDRTRSTIHTNVETPLFLNTVGSWPFRPQAKTRFENLVVSGDYCRSAADLTSMEGAFQSGLNAANTVLTRLKQNASEILPIPRYPRWLLRILVWSGVPFILLVFCYGWLREKLEDKPDQNQPRPRRMNWVWRSPGSSQKKS